MMGELLCVLGAFLLFGLVMLATSLRVVPEHQRLVVFRLGRVLDKPKGPGLVVLIPILDRAAKVNLSEQECEVSNETATTKDYKPVVFSFRWHYKVLDPLKYILEIASPEKATAGISSKKTRELVREVNCADLSSERERIRYMVNSYLDEVTGQWGITVTKFELTDIAVDDQSK